jgi:PAS domain S-box-containing protein
MDATDADYRDLVEEQQDLIVKISLEGRLRFTNRAYCELLGKSREELDGSVFMPVTSERYSDALATQMTKLFRPPYTCVVDQWLQTKIGLRCISWSIRSVLDGNSSPVALVATGRDTTPLKSNQKATRKRDEELLLLIESGPQMYYSHTPDHRTTYASPRIRSLLKCTGGGKKKAWTDFLTDNPVNAAGLERTLRAVTSGKREPPYRLEMEAEYGTRVWIEVNEIPGCEERQNGRDRRLPHRHYQRRCMWTRASRRQNSSSRVSGPQRAEGRLALAAAGHPIDLRQGRGCRRGIGVIFQNITGRLFFSGYVPLLSGTIDELIMIRDGSCAFFPRGIPAATPAGRPRGGFDDRKRPQSDAKKNVSSILPRPHDCLPVAAVALIRNTQPFLGFNPFRNKNRL